MTAYTFSQLFDFTRTTAGTFVGSNGLIQNTPASVNLLTFTQEFDNAAWVKQAGTSISANAASAPDGTLTADAFVKGSGTTGAADLYRDAGVSALGVPSLLSIFVKANGIPAVRITGGGSYSPNGQSRFDLVSGTVVAGGGSITAFGNGWYRCVISLTRTSTADNSVYIAPCNVDGTFPVGNGVSGILLWGAQLEAGSTATTYTRNNGGVYPARFDYDPVTLAAKGILIEEQRTNLLLQSQNFDVTWGKTAVTVTVDTTVAPDGTTTADTLTASTNTAYVSQSVVFTADGDKTFSVFLKAGTSTSTRLTLRDITVPANRATIDITWTAGVPSGVAATGTLQGIDSFGNGWYRVRGLATGVIAANGNQFRFSPDVAVGTNNVIMWGAQTENGAFATSYIPTVASQVTRSADICTITAPMFAPWYNQSEGTWVASFTPYVANFGVVTQISAATNNDRFQLLNDNSGQIAVSTGGAGQGTIDAGTVSAGLTNSLSYAYRTNDTAASLNGGVVGTDTTVTLPVVDRLCVGATVAPAGFLCGHIRSIRYYPFRASNNQLQALTT
jgi:hypothetical protein